MVVTALRKTMVRAHRQAWAWQDEWCGLTMDDIRQIEKQTQEALKMTMAGEQIIDLKQYNKYFKITLPGAVGFQY